MKAADSLDEGLILRIGYPQRLSKYIWKKGSVCLNGVSLTVNEASHGELEVCLIPETLKRTNMGFLKAGDSIGIEIDFMARGLVKSFGESASQQREGTV